MHPARLCRNKYHPSLGPTSSRALCANQSHIDPRIRHAFNGHLMFTTPDRHWPSKMFETSGARFRRKKIILKIIMKIILKCNVDFQTCVNYQFFPFQDNFFGSSELRGGSQYWKFVIFLVCFRNLVIIFVMIFVMIFVIIFVIIFFLWNRAPVLTGATDGN